MAWNACCWSASEAEIQTSADTVQAQNVATGKLADGISESRINGHTGYRRSIIRNAFFELQAAHPNLYRVKRLAREEYAIERAKPGQPVSFTAPSSVRKGLRKHVLGIISAAVGVSLALGGFKLREHLGLPSWLSFAGGLLIAYFGQVVQRLINQRAENSRD